VCPRAPAGEDEIQVNRMLSLRSTGFDDSSERSFAARSARVVNFDLQSD
jgi:hypothetical protein